MAKRASRQAAPPRASKPKPKPKTAKRAARSKSARASVLVTGGTRGVEPARYLAEPAFLSNAKRLFWNNQRREAPTYEGLIYTLEPPADLPLLERMAAFRTGASVPALGKGDVEQRLSRVLRTIRYPATEPLLDLGSVEGLTMPALTAILHFHHPAYPIYSPALVRGLNRVGFPVVFRETVTEESIADYEGVIAALDRLKERITFENVPESNCFLTRVLEGALVAYAAEENGAKGRRKAR